MSKNKAVKNTSIKHPATQTLKNKHSFQPEENNTKKDFFQLLIPPAILGFITWLFYYPSLRYPFQFDDLANITKKFSIRFDNPFTRWYSNPRWIGDLLNRINYQLTEFNPLSYRIFNVLIHIFSGAFLFFFILNLCAFLKKDTFLKKNSYLIATITTALFLLHPVQTQAVSYVIQARLEGLATLFIVASLYFFTKAFLVKNKVTSVILLLTSMIITYLSFGTKEMVVSAPFLILAVDWFFISDENWIKFKKRIPFYLIFFVTFSIILINYLSLNLVKEIFSLKMAVTNNRGNILTKHAHDLITAKDFFISSFKVILHYLLIYLWPFNISVEYDWKLSDSFFDMDVFFPFIILSGLVGFIIYSMINKKFKFVAFGLTWFFFAIAPRSSIIPSSELICDYKAYLASIGWLFIFAVILTFFIQQLGSYLTKKIKHLPFTQNDLAINWVILLLLSCGLGFSSYERNLVWQTPVDFWQDIVIKAPNKARAHNNLGVALAEAARYDEAIKEYQKAINLDQFYSDPLSNLGVVYSIKGEIDKAISAFKKAIYIFPHYPEAYNNIGKLLIEKKQFDQAELALNNALKLRPYYGKAFLNLGNLYLAKNEPEKALEYYEKATQGDLDNKEGFFALGQLCMQLKKYEKAIEAYKNSIKKGAGDHPAVLFNLANAYFLNNQFDNAKFIYQKLVTAHPFEAKYLYNLAETHFQMGEIEKALELFQKTTSMPEPVPQAFIRSAACLAQLKKFDEAESYLNKILSNNLPENFKKLVQNQLEQIQVMKEKKPMAIKVTGSKTIKMSELQQLLKEAAQKGKTHIDLDKDAKTTSS